MKTQIVKWLSIGIIILLVRTSIIPTTAQSIQKQAIPSSRGNWLYVGGSGPGNYTRIQDAIDNASHQDTVFVYNGIYKENIVIKKSLWLTGQDKYLTIINASDFKHTIYVEATAVYISGFTLQQGEPYGSHNPAGVDIASSMFVIISNSIIKNNYFGIHIYSSHSVISDRNILCENVEAIYGIQSSGIHVLENTISNNSRVAYIEFGYNCGFDNNSIYQNNPGSVYIRSSQQIYVTNNSIILNDKGVTFDCCDTCKIVSNLFSSNTKQNIYLGNTLDGTIKNNIFENSMAGILLHLCENTVVSVNNISNHTLYGFFDDHSLSTEVKRNNFINNTPHAFFWDSIIHFDENYWGSTIRHPKFIFGWRTSIIFQLSFPIVTFDWHPAQEPYDI